MPHFPSWPQVFYTWWCPTLIKDMQIDRDVLGANVIKKGAL